MRLELFMEDYPGARWCALCHQIIDEREFSRVQLDAVGHYENVCRKCKEELREP